MSNREYDEFKESKLKELEEKVKLYMIRNLSILLFITVALIMLNANLILAMNHSFFHLNNPTYLIGVYSAFSIGGLFYLLFVKNNKKNIVNISISYMIVTLFCGILLGALRATDLYFGIDFAMYSLVFSLAIYQYNKRYDGLDANILVRKVIEEIGDNEEFIKYKKLIEEESIKIFNKKDTAKEGKLRLQSLLESDSSKDLLEAMYVNEKLKD